MNLTTNYLGLKLKSPLMPGASPLVDNLDNIKRLEDAGASAIVMHSLFAEQIEGNRVAFDQHVDRWQDNFAEATSFFPSTEGFAFGPQEYLEQIAKIKAATSLPVIASLNGTNLGTWVDHAKLIEQAGASALELNTYFLGTSRRTDAIALEHRVLDIVRAVRKSVTLPISVKLSPFYTSVAHLAGRIEDEKVQGVVLFNRFFQPEIDTEALDALSGYPWPGNVRELENAIERACALCEESVIHLSDLPTQVTRGGDKPQSGTPDQLPIGQSLDLFVKDLERRFIEETIQFNEGSRDRAAKMLGISMATLYRKLAV